MWRHDNFHGIHEKLMCDITVSEGGKVSLGKSWVASEGVGYHLWLWTPPLLIYQPLGHFSCLCSLLRLQSWWFFSPLSRRIQKPLLTDWLIDGHEPGSSIFALCKKRISYSTALDEALQGVQRWKGVTVGQKTSPTKQEVTSFTPWPSSCPHNTSPLEILFFLFNSLSSHYLLFWLQIPSSERKN